jgi:histidinol-phosphate aminotransferase
MVRTNDNILNIKEYVPSERVYNPNFKKLDWNECNIPINSKYLEILQNSIKNINLTEYPNVNNQFLIKKISLYCGVDSSNIQIFNGSDSALTYIFATFLNLDSRVLIFHPNYNQIESFIRLYTKYLSFSKIENIFSSHDYNLNDVKNCNVIYFSNPNNPTGYYLSNQIIEQLISNYPQKLFVVDEAYFEFARQTAIELIKKYDNLIIIRTFSKAFSMASIRLGYICAQESIISIINKIRNIKEVNSFAQVLAETALDNIDFIKERINVITFNREFFKKRLKSLSIPYTQSQANFLLIKMKNSLKFINECLNNHILVRDRNSIKGLENCVRITVGEIEDIKKILNIIKLQK